MYAPTYALCGCGRVHSACTAPTNVFGLLTILNTNDKKREALDRERRPSQMGGVYDVVEISMISRGMTVQSLVIRLLDDIIHAISRVRYPVRVRYRSRDILHCGDVAAAISGLGEGYLCCVLYDFIPLILSI